MAGVTPNIRLNLPTYDQPGWDTLMNANLQVLDSLVARSISLTGSYAGIYTAGSSYTINQVVTDPADSALWQANSGFTTSAANTFAQERVANPAHWSNVTVSTVNAGASATIASGAATTATTASTAAGASQVAAAASATAAATSATLAAAGASFNNVGRNLFHNSMDSVLQRGAGPWTTGTHMSDRWLVGLAGGTTYTGTAIGLSDSDRTAIGDEIAQYGLQFVFVGGAAAGDALAVVQRIENVHRLAGKTITVSFWAKCAAGTMKVGISTDQLFGSGGSPSTLVTNNGLSVTVNTTWTRYSVTLSVPTVIGKSIGTNGDDFTQIQFWMSAGATNAARSGTIGVQSGTLQLFGRQCEIASSASALERIDISTEYFNCGRFYQPKQTIITGYGVTGAGTSQTVAFTPMMRAVPTTTITTSACSNITSPGITPIGFGGRETWVNGQVTATGAWSFNIVWNASADL